MNTITESKFFLKSTTIWGAIIAAIPSVVNQLDQIAALPIIPPKYAAIITISGATLAAVGRFMAKVPVTLTPPK